MLVTEEDRRSALVLPDLDGLDDPAVRDALQYLVLTAGRAIGRLLRRLGGHVSDQVNADATLLLDKSVVARCQAVLPGLPTVQGCGCSFQASPNLRWAVDCCTPMAFSRRGRVSREKSGVMRRSGRSGGSPRKSCQMRFRPVGRSSRP